MYIPEVPGDPASSLEIRDAIDSLKPFGLAPEALLSVWKKWNGFEADTLNFYSTNSILERNEFFQTLQQCPGHLVFANDFGSSLALLSPSPQSPQVFLTTVASLEPDLLEDTGMGLMAWIEAGCPFDLNVYPEVLATEPVILRLVAAPKGGLKSLAEIKKIAQLTVGFSELKNFVNKLPVSLCETSYIRALDLAAEINKNSICVRIVRKSDGEPLSLEDPF